MTRTFNTESPGLTCQVVGMGPDHVQQLVRREGGWLSTEELLDKEETDKIPTYSDGLIWGTVPPPSPPPKKKITGEH